MKNYRILWFLLPLVGLNKAFACDEYEPFTLEEIKEFRAVLQNKESSSLDMLFAFEQMACSDRPTVRHFALEEGLKNFKDPLVRNEILLRAIMQKSTINIVLSETRDLTSKDKAFIAQHAGVYSHDIVYRSMPDGCIGLYTKDCQVAYSVFIHGDKVQFRYGVIIGEFVLADTNELVGTIRGGKTKDYTQIPAVIKLL